jgi:hypothetical protein
MINKNVRLLAQTFRRKYQVNWRGEIFPVVWKQENPLLLS